MVYLERLETTSMEYGSTKYFLFKGCIRGQYFERSIYVEVILVYMLHVCALCELGFIVTPFFCSLKWCI